jgi:hypothetical protein
VTFASVFFPRQSLNGLTTAAKLELHQTDEEALHVFAVQAAVLWGIPSLAKII